MNREKWATGAAGWLLSGLFGLACGACMVTGFDMHVSLSRLALYCFAVGGVCAFCYSTKLGFVPICLLAAVMGYQFQSGALEKGFNAVTHVITEVYSRGYGWQAFAWDGSAASLSRSLFTGVFTVCVPVVMLTAWSLCRGGTVAPGILASLPAISTWLVVTDTVPETLWLAVLFCTVALLLISSKTRQQNSRQGLKLLLWASAPVLLGVLLLFALIPRDSYTADRLAQNMADEIVSGQAVQNVWETVTGQGSVSTGATGAREVDLRNVGRLHTTDAPILSVKAEFSGTVYLRGGVLDSYDGTQWYSGETDETLPWPDRTYLTEETVMEIDTRSAHRMLYLPYYDMGTDMEGDGRGVENEDKLTKYSLMCARMETERVMEELYPDRSSANPHDVLSGQYTALPDDVAQWAWETARSAIAPGTENDYYRAQDIAAYVRASAQYDKQTAKMPRGETDFARWFLEQSDTGYCVHFATAAAVLLKSVGIPARYATGYMVEVTAGQTVQVLASDAHAWVEYYLPGFGWTVLESTPGAGGDQTAWATDPQVTQAPSTTPSQNPTAQTPHTPTTAPTGTAPAHPTTDGQTNSRTDSQTTEKKKTSSWLGKILTALAWAALTAAVICGQWRLRMLIRKMRMKGGQPNGQALRRWKLLETMCRAGRMTAPPACFELAQKAKFSQHTVTPEEMRTLDRQLRAATQTLRGKNVLAQIYYRLILALYYGKRNRKKAGDEPMFSGFSPETADFLWGIRMNNNREWFLSHKQDYVNYLYEPMKALGKALFQPFLDRPGNILKVSRIYRDARLHHPLPYKESLWICIRREVEWWGQNPCLFFEIRPEGVCYGFALWQPTPVAMEAFRRAISARPEEFRKLIRQVQTQTGVTVTADCYKRPKPAPTEALAPYFAWKGNLDCTVTEPFSPAVFGAALGDRVGAFLEKLIPLYEYFYRFTT